MSKSAPFRLEPAATCLGSHHREPSFSTSTPSIRKGLANLRIPTDPETPLEAAAHYDNAIAGHYAGLGYVEFAELIEAGYACSACHLTHQLNRIPTDQELDLERFEQVALVGRLARVIAELGAEALMGASAQIDKVLARQLAEKITVRNMIDPIDPITARQISQILLEDPVAYRSYRQLQEHGTEVVLDFGLGPSRTMGLAFPATNSIKVFVRNHASARDAVSTIVHESSHIHRAFRHSPSTMLDEVRARSREFLYQQARRPDRAERRAIWNEVRDLPEYDQLPER